MLARMLGDKLSRALGQSVIVENKTGAAGNIGAAYVARASPDGYTFLLHSSTVTANVSLYTDMGFDPQTDLAPVSEIGLMPNVLMVSTSFPATTLSDFVNLVKEKKTPINYGSAGSGSSSHISGALFNHMAGGSMQHIPYKGGAPANADLVAGRLQAVFSPMSEILGYLDGGKLRALAVTTKSRSPRLPDVPVVSDVLPGYEVELWFGVFAPAHTPNDVVARMSAALRKVILEPAMRNKLQSQGITPLGSTPEEFKEVVTSEIAKWRKLNAIAGAKVE